MVNYTTHHSFQLWQDDETGWEHRTDFDKLDTLLKGMGSNGDALDLSTLTLATLNGAVTNNTDLTDLEGANLSIDSNGVLNAAASGMTASDLIASPNGSLQTAALADGESSEITQPVPAGQTLTIYRWGGYTIPNGDAPSGLTVELLDDSDTVQASANTVDNSNTNGVASYDNSSGTLSVFKLRVSNTTGTDYTGTDEGIGAMFAYEVA